MTLAHRFFVRGTFLRTPPFGGAPLIQFNNLRYGETDIEVSDWLKDDVALLSETLKIGFFDYGPRLWMLGEIEPLKGLQDGARRSETILRIMNEYPARLMFSDEHFYRLRRDLVNPSDPHEYDSPPSPLCGRGRMDTSEMPVMYASQDLEVCLHECRVTVEDQLFLATLRPARRLKFLDLTAVLREDGTEFESLDLALHMLFSAGEHAYEITRAIAVAAKEGGFDGLVYPSYFSIVRTGAMPFETAYGISVRKFPNAEGIAAAQVAPNVALFGRPIETGLVDVVCLNRLWLERIAYDVFFGPVNR